MSKAETETQVERAKAPTPGAIVLDWWLRLNGEIDDARPDRGAIARLRRCDGPDDVDLLLSPAFRRLRRRLTNIVRDEDAVATAAIVAAHVRSHVPGMPFARQLGPSKAEAEDGVMTEQRFRRLLQSEPGPELTRALVRAVRLLGSGVNLEDLATGALFWTPQTRRRWAFQYFNAGDAVPADRMDAGRLRNEESTNGGTS